MAWHGMARRGMAFVWRGTAWYGICVAWHGMVRHLRGVARRGAAWRGMARLGVTWHDLAWH
eukprot:13134976-Heterocapsa_arctica.AAC.1